MSAVVCLQRLLYLQPSGLHYITEPNVSMEHLLVLCHMVKKTDFLSRATQGH